MDTKILRFSRYGKLVVFENGAQVLVSYSFCYNKNSEEIIQIAKMCLNGSNVEGVKTLTKGQ